MKNPKKSRPKNPPKLQIIFAEKSRKKDSILYKIGGKFTTKEKYLEASGLTPSQFEWAIESVRKPAENDKGQLPKSARKSVAELFNAFISAKKPTSYELTINIKSAKSISALDGMDIFVNYRGEEFKFTYNDFIYLCESILQNMQTNVYYFAVKSKINEVEKTAIIHL